MQIITAAIIVALASFDAGKTEVDVIRLPEEVFQKLADKYPDEAKIPLTERLLPAEIRGATDWTVALQGKVVRRRAKYCIAQPGAGEGHLTVVLEGIAGVPAGEALATTGPSRGVGPLRKPAPLRASAAALSRLDQQVRAALSAEQRSRAPRGKLAAGHVTLVKPAGPHADRLLAVVSVPLSGDSVPMYMSAAAWVGQDGAVQDWISKPSVSIDTYSAPYFIDLNGDGADEVIFRSSYYEGEYTHLLRDAGPGKRVVLETLSGDGA